MPQRSRVHNSVLCPEAFAAFKLQQDHLLQILTGSGPWYQMLPRLTHLAEIFTCGCKSKVPNNILSRPAHVCLGHALHVHIIAGRKGSGLKGNIKSCWHDAVQTMQILWYDPLTQAAYRCTDHMHVQSVFNCVKSALDYTYIYVTC